MHCIYVTRLLALPWHYFIKFQGLRFLRKSCKESFLFPEQIWSCHRCEIDQKRGWKLIKSYNRNITMEGTRGRSHYHSISLNHLFERLLGKKTMKSKKGLQGERWRWGCWEYGVKFLHRLSSWNQRQRVWDWLCCHIYCAHLETPWHKIVGASRGVSSRDLRCSLPKAYSWKNKLVFNGRGEKRNQKRQKQNDFLVQTQGPGRMVQTPQASMGDSVCRSLLFVCSIVLTRLGLSMLFPLAYVALSWLNCSLLRVWMFGDYCQPTIWI